MSASLIILILIFAAGIFLYKKGIIKKKDGAPSEGSCDNDFSVPSSYNSLNLQYEVRMFELTFISDKDNAQREMDIRSANIQKSITDLTNLFFTRGESYDVEFHVVGCYLVAIVKHWE